MLYREKIPALSAILCSAVFLFGCATKRASDTARIKNQLPPVILWAWERPEDLTFLNSERVGVAFLAQTLVLQNDEVVLRPRLQPLKVLPDTKLIAVTRIESSKLTGGKADLSEAQEEKLTKLISKTLQLENVLAIQIDFDVTRSEREFYRRLLGRLRQSLPEHVPLTMTALASFCVGDRWLQGLPVDEAVPMIFRMGLDSENIKRFLASGNDFKEPLCRRSYGIAVDEPLEMTFEKGRSLYIFNHNSWAAKDVPAEGEWTK